MLLLGCSKTAQTTASQARNLRLAGIDGESYSPLELGPHRAAVIIFISQDCPIANSYAPEINRIVSEYAAQNVAFYLAHEENDVTMASAREHAQAFQLQGHVLLDPAHQLARELGATVTPEAAVIDSANRIAYRGRIDDRYVAFGKRRAAPNRRDLREALDALLAGEDVPQSRTVAIGCAIPTQKASKE